MLTTDFHTHILPEIDDGSPNIDESIKMIQQEIEQGIKTIILTPHFSAQELYPSEFLRQRATAFEKLNCALSNESDLPQFLLGAEVQFCSGMSQWEQLIQLTIGNTGYLLLEMPDCVWDNDIYRELETIYIERGITPILAHIERYLGPFNQKRILNRLADLPVLLQMNCSFIIDKHTHRTAIKLINERRIHIIGSDCHSSEWRRPCMAEMRELINTSINDDVRASLSVNEAAILKGEDLIVINSSF